MVNVVIFGAPGSGKGTQSELIIEKYGLHHISTGEVLRDEIAKNTELGKTADSYISKGNLVPDDLIVDILDNMLDEQMLNKGIILDGFPRTINQAKSLQKMLGKRGHEVSAVIGLEVHEDELVDRLLKRGQVSGRSDDNTETIKQRIQVYHRNTEPLMDYYKQAGIYYPIEGEGSVENISEKITNVLTPISDKEAEMRTA